MSKDSTKAAEKKLIQDVEQILEFNKKLAPIGTQRMFVPDSYCESLVASIRSKDSEIESLEAKLKIARDEKNLILERIAYAMEHGNAALNGVQDKDNALHHIMSSLSSLF